MIEVGDKITSKFDGEICTVTKVLKSKIYYQDSTGSVYSDSKHIIIECYNLATKETDSAPEKKPLFLIMQNKWFDEILAGRKDEEYRENTPFYRSRFLDKKGQLKNYKTVIMQVGYHTNARRMTLEVRAVTSSGMFTVHLGRIIEKNF